ncbi:DUF58 domain-containing protein [Natronorubrum daqingense]|uniref:Uncharacterized conserved protein, DUF58 family, contains vWF domain n=1 Tax=Natronorubrum daqingense TaxID=588898 RepID=A0A1N7EC92_9EURY|nr:DUF58 domain-containing protein [Natronorubrum daqingense]APX96475.1 hypothetical protein BB347_07515 [Natronorubrum daqingense]SIR85535.1 Uncharacterized conserved protein, DUF58 family, contains vWF domain [Natronorubrum daqingense]
MRRQSITTALGVATFLLGVGAIVVDSPGFGLTDETIVLVGVATVILGLSILSRGYDSRSHTETPDPERRLTVPTPGHSISTVLTDFRALMSGSTDLGPRITAGLRGAAVTSLTRFRGLSTDEAATRVANGTWSSNQIATDFLKSPQELPSRSIRTRLESVVTRSVESPFRLGVRHTVAAIVALRDADPLEDDRGTLRREESLPTFEWSSSSATNSLSSDEFTTSVHATADSEGLVQHRRHPTNHWMGVGAIALLAVGSGALADAPALVLAGVVGIGYAGFARALEPTRPDLALERTLSDDDPEPGDDVTVSLTITNESDGFVPDLRFVDGVPDGLAVTGGSSRLGTAFRPGESLVHKYTVTARRGRHTFDPALVFVRDLSRSTELECSLFAETTLTSEPSMRPLATQIPLRNETTTATGRIRTAKGGTGTTIHSVREYRSGDSLARIDWKRRAKTGDLATLEFHEERAARVVVLVDARKASYRAPEADTAHAVDRAVDAAGRIGATLFDTDHTVGLAAIGPVARDGVDSNGVDACWLPPGSGRHHEARFRSQLATHPQFDTRPPTAECRWRRQLRSLRRRLPADSQLVLLTPLLDFEAAKLARTLEAHGHQVTVVSPDPTADRTAGEQLSSVARSIRRLDLQRAGIPVVDWPDDESLDAALARYSRGRR